MQDKELFNWLMYLTGNPEFCIGGQLKPYVNRLESVEEEIQSLNDSITVLRRKLNCLLEEESDLREKIEFIRNVMEQS